MNHRFSVRIPLRVEVKLSRHGNDLGHYMTRNIDSDGAFVDVRGLVLHPNDFLELEVRLPRENPGHVAVKALVVRNTVTGVGLLFTNSSAGLTQQIGTHIQELLETETLQDLDRHRRAAGF